MKTKSIINFKNLTDLGRANLVWGQIVFESYWKRDSAGNVKESSPTTSEFLESFWWPYQCELDGLEIKMEGLSTGLFIETLTQPDGSTIERIVLKPKESPPDKVDFLAALEENVKKRFAKQNFLQRLLTKLTNF